VPFENYSGEEIISFLSSRMRNAGFRSGFSKALLIAIFLISRFLFGAYNKEREIANSGRKVIVQNEQIKIAVGGDGRFTIGTTDGRALLFAFPSEGATSHTNFYVDGVILGTYSDVGAHPDPAPITLVPSLIGGSVVCRWRISGVDITQTLTPTYWAGRGTALIEYSITNHDSRAHSVGLLLFFDTMINRNDYAPIATQFGYFETSQEFYAPDIPYFWQAYESSPFQSADSLVGQGILVGGEATPPDILLYGNYWRYHTVFWDWTFYSEPYTDSAVLMRWNPVNLLPNQTVRIATYYGIGSADIVLGRLNLSLSSPSQLSVHDCSEYSPNPFPVNLIATNTTISTLRGLRATIDLPAGLSLVDPSQTRSLVPDSLATGEMGTVSWLVRADSTFESDTSLCFTIEVSSPNLDSASHISSCILVPRITGSGPALEYISPPYQYVSCDPVGFLFRVGEAEDIATSSVVLYVNGRAERLFESPYLDFAPPNLLARIPYSLVAPGDSIALSLEASDMNGCVSRLNAPFTVYIDRIPPTVLSVSPANGGVVLTPDFTITARINDNLSGVLGDSLFLTINGVYNYRRGSAGFDFSSGVLTFSSARAGLNFTESETLHICIGGIMDNAQVCGANRAPQYCWSFFLNLERPSARIVAPQPNATISCDTVDIIVQLFDLFGIDTSSLIFNINGRTYSTENPEVWIDGSFAHLMLLSGLYSGEEIRVAFFAQNIYGVSIPETLRWSFTLDYDPPYVWGESPRAWSTIYNPFNPISIHIADTVSGLSRSSVYIVISSARGLNDTLRYGDRGLYFQSDSILVVPEERGLRFIGRDTVWVELYAEDSPDSCEPNRFRFLWGFFTPAESPTSLLIFPEDSLIVSCDSMNVGFLLYAPATLEESSVRVRIRIDDFERIYPIDGHNVVARGETILVSVYGYENGDRVSVEIDSANDIFGNGLESRASVHFRADLSPPNLLHISPADGETTESIYPTISFAVVDSISGVDSVSVSISLDGVPFDLTPYLYASGDSFYISTFDAGIRMVGNSEVIVCILASDNAHLCGANLLDTCITFYVSGVGPLVEWIFPPESTITACEGEAFGLTFHSSVPINAESIIFTMLGDTFTVYSPGVFYANDTLVFLPPPHFLPERGIFTFALIDVRDSLGNRARGLPMEWVFWSDFLPPEVISMEPHNGDTVSWVYHPITLSFRDVPSGVNLDSIVFILNESRFVYGSPGLSVSDSMLIFEPRVAGVELADSNTLRVRLVDKPDNCSNSVWVEWRFYVNRAGPELTSYFPHNNSIISCNPVLIWAYIYDPDDVSVESLRVDINGILITHDSTSFFFSNDTLKIRLAENYFSASDTVRVKIYGLYDRFGNASTDTVSFRFLLDYDPPLFRLIHPASQETLSGTDFRALFLVNDAIAGLDSGSLAFVVNGISGNLGSEGFEQVGDTIIFDPSAFGLEIYGGERIEVCVHAGDRVEICQPNLLDTCFAYFISNYGPRFTLLAPLDRTISHLRAQPIIFTATDEEGIDTNSIVVSVDGHNYTVGSGGFSFYGDTVVFTPREGWTEGEHTLRIMGKDILNNPGNTAQTNFFVDLSPPSIRGITPDPAQGQVPDLTEITIWLYDSISGVDPTSIIFSVNNDTLRYPSPSIVWDGERMHFQLASSGYVAQPGLIFRFCLINVSDNPPNYGEPNSIAEPYCFELTIDAKECKVYPVPFTPNGDGFNDFVFFEFPGYGHRWGNLVNIYSLSGMQVKTIDTRTIYDGKLLWVWDGRDSYNKDAQPGAYIYVIKSDGKIICQGIITLMR